MEKLYHFVYIHRNDDTINLMLKRDKWPEVDMELAVNCIESRRKIRTKVQEWYDVPELIFPFKLSAEQCSSSATARYKAELADRVMQSAPFRLADLTGGLGVDSWFFSKKAEQVMYNEMQPRLCEAAMHNFKVLHADNIQISNNAVTPENCTQILAGFHPDIIYMDPARRADNGRKVFLLEDCTPDVLRLKDRLFEACRHILLKLSPMADVKMACERLGDKCREVHIAASSGECKEMLIWMDREWHGEYTVTAVELAEDGIRGSLSFLPSEEATATPIFLNDNPLQTDLSQNRWLFEPGKALMKAGAFNLVGTRFNLEKLGRSTHYYITDSPYDMAAYGKLYRIVKVLPLDKRSMKAIGKEYPAAEVTARNIPMDTETLRKRLGVASGGNIHIFGLRSDRHGHLLFITERS